ncbi:Rho termination factor N-terminal domain-containing protein [Conexibacter sp. DBS9H8]|uniref:Rho termination factor N-terminal domain-containing protein n=1 Tax=Conexibacter sp. DBS9H8 TaxID=2937801 RepID=UPI00200DC590|nr:Rho termination factor N-terminal domain-containing protein [Conexibacter sp. DBS9H8]
MTVLDRAALEASPLADLHAIAADISLDGYRRLRKAALIDAIIARQTGVEPGEPAEPAETAETGTGGVDAVDAAAADADEDDGESTAASRRRRGRRGGRGRAGGRETEETAPDAEVVPEADAEAEARTPRGGPATIVEGVVELLANGSGFLRVAPPDPSDDDVYISAAQVKRCELVSGDTVSGPRRAPQRSERFASLVRVDTINGRPASEVADRARYDELAARFPDERFKLASEDATLKAVEFLTPLGRGSRVSLVGPAWAGKSHTLKDLARALAGEESLTVFVALAGVRPEELADWGAEAAGLPATAVSLSFAASADAQDHAVEMVIEQAKRVATRGGDAVVLVDTLDGLNPGTARKVLAAARNLSDAGSLTVIATARTPIGGETTVIALDPALTSTGRFPALDLVNSGTLRPELLVGEAGARAIAEARSEAYGLE